LSVAAIVLTLNEKPRIEECLQNLKPYVDYLLVLDGCSTDGTIEAAKKYADKVEVKPFSGSFADERNDAMSLVPFWCDYVLFCDADERFPEEFLKNMKEIIKVRSNADSFRFPRISLVTEEEAKTLDPSRLSSSPHGPCKDYPDRQIRLVRRNAVAWKGQVDEVPYSLTDSATLDEYEFMGERHRTRKLVLGRSVDQVSCVTFGEEPIFPTYAIIHLPRRRDIKREWW